MSLDPLYPEIAKHFVAEPRFALGQFDLPLEAVRREDRTQPVHVFLTSPICH
jgi:hypothetical protein